MCKQGVDNIWAPSSEFVSSSIPSWQILTAHAQPFRGTRDLAFCLKVPLDSLLVWASSGGSGETVRMCRLAWTFAARIGDKYQIRLTRSILKIFTFPGQVLQIGESLDLWDSWRSHCFWSTDHQLVCAVYSTVCILLAINNDIVAFPFCTQTEILKPLNPWD